jgi:hypothetical protein
VELPSPFEKSLDSPLSRKNLGDSNHSLENMDDICRNLYNWSVSSLAVGK